MICIKRALIWAQPEISSSNSLVVMLLQRKLLGGGCCWNFVINTARNQHPRDGNRGTLLSSKISWGVLVYEARRQWLWIFLGAVFCTGTPHFEWWRWLLWKLNFFVSPHIGRPQTSANLLNWTGGSTRPGVRVAIEVKLLIGALGGPQGYHGKQNQ